MSKTGKKPEKGDKPPASSDHKSEKSKDHKSDTHTHKSHSKTEGDGHKPKDTKDKPKDHHHKDKDKDNKDGEKGPEKSKSKTSAATAASKSVISGPVIVVREGRSPADICFIVTSWILSIILVFLVPTAMVIVGGMYFKAKCNTQVALLLVIGGGVLIFLWIVAVILYLIEYCKSKKKKEQAKKDKEKDPEKEQKESEKKPKITALDVVGIIRLLFFFAWFIALCVFVFSLIPWNSGKCDEVLFKFGLAVCIFYFIIIFLVILILCCLCCVMMASPQVYYIS